MRSMRATTTFSGSIKSLINWTWSFIKKKNSQVMKSWWRFKRPNRNFCPLAVLIAHREYKHFSCLEVTLGSLCVYGQDPSLKNNRVMLRNAKQ